MALDKMKVYPYNEGRLKEGAKRMESQTVTIGYDHKRKLWVLWHGIEPKPAGKFLFESLRELWEYVSEELEELSYS